MRPRGDFANWRIPQEWKGETVFVIGGGPSVAYQRPARLEGRKVIVINSSYEVAPFAQYLFFGDNRWHEEHRNRPAFKAFLARGGNVVTVSGPSGAPYLLKLLRVVPTSDANGLTTTCRGLSSQKTSFQGGINLAAMLGAKRIVLLGLDGRRSESGLSHHHSPHKWPTKPGDVTWVRQRTQLQYIVKPLRDRGIDVFNTCPYSTFKFWPYAPLEGFL
jgi:hypothetical protein